MPRTTRQELKRLHEQAETELGKALSSYAKMLETMRQVALAAQRGELEWNDTYERQGDEYAALCEMVQGVIDASQFVLKDY